MNSEKEYYIGFDLGGTKMISAVVDSKLNILGHSKQKTKAYEGFKPAFQRIIQTIDESLSNSGIALKDIKGIGMGYPGAVDYKTGIVHSSVNLGWEEVNLRKIIEKQFKCKVGIINDVDAGTYGEYVSGAAKGARSAIGIFIGTGIGGGFVYEGRIMHGKNMSCFELGHMQLVPDGPLCGCGKRGCFETLASRLAISGSAAIAAYRGKAQYLLKNKGMDISDIKSRVVASAIKAGDNTLKEIVLEAANWIGIASANLINLLLPDIIVLGGGVIEAMPSLICDQVLKTAIGRVLPSYNNTFKIVPSFHKDSANLIGAAAFVKESSGI